MSLIQGDKSRHFVLFFIALNLAYIGIQTPYFTIRWDAFDLSLPFFRFIGSSLRQGHFPDYLPYLFSGYPLGGDLPVGVYNPVVWFFAALFPNSSISVNLIFMFLMGLMFWSSYRIGRQYFKAPATALYFALGIIACGAVVGNASHLSFQFCYMGFVLFFCGLVHLSSDQRAPAFLNMFFSTWCMLTSGYPVLIFTNAQVLFLAFVYFLYRSRGLRFQFFVRTIIPVGLASLLALPALVHFMYTMTYSSRGSGVTLETLRLGSLPLKALFGLLVPLASVKSTSLDGTMAQMNLLIGTPFLLGIFAFKFLTKKGWPQSLGKLSAAGLLLASAIFLTLILGDNFLFPVREWLAQISIAFRLGRFPASEYKLYLLILLSFFSCLALDDFLSGEVTKKKLLKITYLLLLDFVLVLSFKRGFVIQRVKHDIGPNLALSFNQITQNVFDRPRHCPSQTTLGTSFTDKSLLFGAGIFSATGYSPLVLSDYQRDFSSVSWALCGEGRLFDSETREKVEYTLLDYSPGTVHFRIKTSKLNAVYLWTETRDSFWRISVDGKEIQFIDGPGQLRYFKTNKAGESEVKMIYAGPVSQFFRSIPK
jgi:hypothetical protein